MCCQVVKARPHSCSSRPGINLSLIVSLLCCAVAVSAVALVTAVAVLVHRRRKMQQQQQLPCHVPGSDKTTADPPLGTAKESLQDDKLTKR
jgi:hypothetical protein